LKKHNLNINWKIGVLIIKYCSHVTIAKPKRAYKGTLDKNKRRIVEIYRILYSPGTQTIGSNSLDTNRSLLDRKDRIKDKPNALSKIPKEYLEWLHLF
jgi:hypothetical protein